jgi:DNA-binding PadR family transcriptional regulator
MRWSHHHDHHGHGARWQHFMRGGRHEERHFGGHGGFGRHGRGRERVFDQGDLRLVILHLIAEKPRHGYELIKAIEEQLGGAYSPSPGVIYPTLTMLEEMGLIAQSASEGSRKLFAITPEGEAHLAENRAALDAIRARMAQLGAREHGIPAPMLRAWENLKLALNLKIRGGTVSAEQAQAIAAKLDALTAEIERL